MHATSLAWIELPRNYISGHETFYAKRNLADATTHSAWIVHWFPKGIFFSRVPFWGSVLFFGGEYLFFTIETVRVAGQIAEAQGAVAKTFGRFDAVVNGIVNLHWHIGIIGIAIIVAENGIVEHFLIFLVILANVQYTGNRRRRVWSKRIWPCSKDVMCHDLGNWHGICGQY